MSRAYYNENDPRAAAWLRELIGAGLIAAGDVDDRSICDVTGSDVRGYRQCHFFAGIGGWSYALRLAGWSDEREVWTGSCPCQPFSVAGRGLATEDERHLWPEFGRLISECCPATVFGEQVSSELGLQWLDGVFADLERCGYAVAGADLCAASVGAPHIRQRLYWVGHTKDDHGRTGVGTTEAGARQDGERGRGFAGSGPTGGLADLSCGGLGIDGCSSGRAGYADERGEVGGLADTGYCAGRAYEQGQREEGRTAHRRFTPWSSSLCPCGDGKARRVGIVAADVADGIPDCLELGGETGMVGLPILTQAEEGRVMLLRGYGNAIVPPLAAEFIKAASSALAGLR